jgi:hypothetical protein
MGIKLQEFVADCAQNKLSLSVGMLLFQNYLKDFDYTLHLWQDFKFFLQTIKLGSYQYSHYYFYTLRKNAAWLIFQITKLITRNFVKIKCTSHYDIKVLFESSSTFLQIQGSVILLLLGQCLWSLSFVCILNCRVWIAHPMLETTLVATES